MASYNRVVLIGNLTRAPELRSLQNGSSVADVGLAVNERRRSQNGEWTEETSFFDITVWERNAEILRDYTRKGSTILIEGRLKQEFWEQDGQKRSKIKVVAERIVLLSSNANGQQRNDADNSPAAKSYASSKSAIGSSQPLNRCNGYSNAPSTGNALSYSSDMPDDIPF